MKNQLIKLLIALSQTKNKKKSPENQNKRFLIVSTTGFGDTLWAVPALRALRHTYPSSYIAALTSEMGDSILENVPYIDELFVVPQPPLLTLLGYFFLLRRKKFDAILIFHASQRIIFPFCALLGAPEIIGTKEINKGLDSILTKGLDRKEQHEIERRLAIVAEVGAQSPDSALEFFIKTEDDQSATKFLEEYHIPSYVPLVGLHPGAKNTYKQWDPIHFVEVGKRLVQHLGCRIVVSGDQEESLLVYEISSQIPGSIPLAGELSVAAFAALLKKMSLFITNDTGPMHLSFAVNTPTVALFCPTNPKLCGPYQAKQAIVIQKSKTCHPCLGKKCEEPFCLLQITPDEVYDQAVSLFYSANPNPSLTTHRS